MVTLADTANITLYRQLSFGEDTFYEVPSFADGNCALNAFALGLIDIIKRGELSLEKELQEYFLYYIRVSLRILEERLALYRGESSEFSGNRYEDVADFLEKFIHFMNTNPSYPVFVEYVKRQTSREEIAALHVGLAPALRHIGVDEHIGSIKTVMSDKEVLNAKMFDEANELYYDGQWAGHDVLSHLASDFFKVNLLIYSEKLQRRVDWLDEPIIDAPCISVLYKGDHYNCLLPQSTLENQDSLAATLTTTTNKKDAEGLSQAVELTTKKLIHPRRSALVFPGLLFPAHGKQVLGALCGVLSIHPDILKRRPDDSKEPPLFWRPILK